jgi:hypothetical protein
MRLMRLTLTRRFASTYGTHCAVIDREDGWLLLPQPRLCL